VRSLTLLLVLCLFAVFFWVGRASVSLSPLPAIDPAAPSISWSSADEKAAFAAMVREWNRYIVRREGYMPGNLIMTLNDVAKFDGFEQLRFYSDVWPLPPRINPDLSQNPRWPLFYRAFDDRNEVWVCYADGTWGRENSAVPANNWITAFKAAGYPILSGMNGGEQKAWLSEHLRKLTWNPRQRLYVVSSGAATSLPFTKPSSSN